MNTQKKVALFLWWILFICFWCFYFLHPDFFKKENLALFFQDFWSYIIVVYLLVSIFRSFFLVPSTVLIFAWALFLEPVTLFILVMTWIVASSSLVFFFSEYLDLDTEIQKKFGKKKVQDIEHKINKYGYFIVAWWSFFPFVPTDVICYIAGTTNMKYWKFLAWLLTWEIPLVILYIALSYWFLTFM